MIRIFAKPLAITAPTKNWRFSASYDSFVVNQTFVLRMKFSGDVSTPFFEPVINWKFKFAEISLSISKGLDYLATDADDLSCNLPSIAMTTLLTGLYLQTSKHQGCLPDSFC